MLSEAERQVLIALVELSEPIETPNNTHYSFYPTSLDDAAQYFGALREEWAPAYRSLLDQGLIEGRPGDCALTGTGAALARQQRLDHPPIWYWYRTFFVLAARSEAYSRFCRRLYGRDLSQSNFSDMAQVDLLMEVAHLGPGDRVLDVGCGRGLFAELLSDSTGARVWGVDYVPEAIEEALDRTSAKRERLDFQVGNLDHLDFAPGSFELVVSIDTLYMPNDLSATLGVLRSLLAPGGKMLVYYSSLLSDPSQPRESLLADHTDLARGLRQARLQYRTWDVSEATVHLMRRKRRLAQEMRAEFEAEGSLFLYDHLIAESDGGTAPYDPQTTTLSRYLYEVTTS